MTELFDPDNAPLHPSFTALPICFNIYCYRSRFKYSTFNLGRHKKEPLVALKQTWKGFLGGTTVLTLHENTDTDTSPIATSIIKKGIKVELPSGSFTPITIQFNRIDSKHYTFQIPNAEGATSGEVYSWNRSKSDNVQALHGRGKKGWELTRQSPGGSGEEETLAVYSVDLDSPKKSGQFMFLNSGATGQGELGRNWVIVSLISALSLGEIQRQNYIILLQAIT